MCCALQNKKVRKVKKATYDQLTEIMEERLREGECNTTCFEFGPFDEEHEEVEQEEDDESNWSDVENENETFGNMSVNLDVEEEEEEGQVQLDEDHDDDISFVGGNGDEERTLEVNDLLEKVKGSYTPTIRGGKRMAEEIMAQKVEERVNNDEQL